MMKRPHFSGSGFGHLLIFIGLLWTMLTPDHPVSAVLGSGGSPSPSKGIGSPVGSR